MSDLVMRHWEESPSSNQPRVPKLWAAGKRLYLRKAAVEHNALADAHIALTAERDRYKAALEKIADEQKIYRGHGDYEFAPALSADEAQALARESLSASIPATSPDTKGE